MRCTITSQLGHCFHLLCLAILKIVATNTSSCIIPAHTCRGSLRPRQYMQIVVWQWGHIRQKSHREGADFPHSVTGKYQRSFEPALIEKPDLFLLDSTDGEIKSHHSVLWKAVSAAHVVAILAFLSKPLSREGEVISTARWVLSVWRHALGPCR